MIVLSLLAAAAAAPAPATTPLDRLTDLYEEVCLHTFPDNKAVDRLMKAKGATPLSPAEVKVTLVDDPGRGWKLMDGERSVLIFVEMPPYHACSVRSGLRGDTMDLTRYNQAAAAFTASRPGFAPIDDYAADRGDIHVHASGVSRDLGKGKTESLYVFDQRVIDPKRLTAGETGVELRFVPQLYAPQ